MQEDAQYEDESSSMQDGQKGSDDEQDDVLRWMKKNGIPLTREAYLNVAYMGDPPEELDAEGESMLPKKFQKWG